MKILVINCGSSSVKFKLFEMPGRVLLANGSVEKIGEEKSIFKYFWSERSGRKDCKISNHTEALELITKFLIDSDNNIIKNLQEIKGIGHRVVHGGEIFTGSVLIDSAVIEKIEEYQTLAPLHNPPNLAGIRAAKKFFPESVQVASFDTAFHARIPDVAFLYAIPHDFYEKHRIRRYGFHGTSHRYVSRRAAELLGKGKYEINCISCHLGNGCSITAVRNGYSVDTSMGFTPLEGLIMGTRSGDIDPGVIIFLGEQLGMSISEIGKFLNRKCGLAGLSGISNDFRNIVEKANAGNVQASLAIDVFCYRVKKYVGAYMAVLGSVDAIIFTAGIGENQPLAREKSLAGLENFGIILDREKNRAAIGIEAKVHHKDSTVNILVIPTNEELAIADDTYRIAGGQQLQ